MTSETTSDYDLSDPTSLLSYLASTPFASTSVTPLSGGSANYIFRLRLKEEYEGRTTLVLKHAKPYVKNAKESAIDVVRQIFEGKSLDRVKRLMEPNAMVTVPAVHFHDTHLHALIMDDGGASGGHNLKQLFIDDATKPAQSRILTEYLCRRLGTEVGKFLAAVHCKGSKDEELMKTCSDNEQGKRLSVWCTYGRLLETVAGTGDSETLIQPPLAASKEELAVVAEIARVRSAEIMSAQDIFTMGDFWTGNVVVNTEPNPNTDEAPHVTQAYVVDWELAKPGLPFLDVGQFVAELLLLRSFIPETERLISTCLDAFLEAYRDALFGETISEAARVDAAFVSYVAVHVGVHLVVWTPRIETWKPAARVRETAEAGLELMLKGWQGDATWLRRSIVGKLLQ